MNRNLSSICTPGTPIKWSLAREMRRNPTAAEAKLWGHLRGHRMLGLKFRRQHVIDGFIADFYCHALKFVIEVDGGVHDTQEEYDRDRQRFFERSGLSILRVTNADVLARPNYVLAKIEIRCHQAMADCGKCEGAPIVPQDGLRKLDPPEALPPYRHNGI
ncbi:MAG: endonuclease domain-containing protein [Capsulimonas sp.]|uniref:endonuclease domain-containing protein n=1 Tax=Capsulimonas sp. TaxID=2494211 RepID=UPI003267EF9E